MKTKETIRQADFRVLIAACCANMVTLYLAYADEGAYNFQWMRTTGNWIAYLFYFALIFGVLLFTSEVLLSWCTPQWKWIGLFIITAFILIMIMGGIDF